jgi:hypothetical protein
VLFVRRLAILLLAVPICASSSSATSCVEVGGTSVWSETGWNHTVYLTNRCSAEVFCDVSTNVAPEPKVVTLSSNVTTPVVTSTGSAARVFVPVVSCDYP